MHLPNEQERDEIAVAYNRWQEAIRRYNALVYECLAGRGPPKARTVDAVRDMYAAFEDYHRSVEPFTG